MNSAIEEYEAVLERIFGVFLDATEGFRHVDEITASIILPDQIAPPKVRDSAGRSPAGYLIYALGKHDEHDYMELCSRTPEEIVADNREDGPNWDFIAKMCIVSAYQFWDDCYRARIAREMGMKREELLVPIFGDLRRLRNCIVHDRSRWSDSLLKMECFGWTEEDRSVEVRISKSDMTSIWWGIRLRLAELKKKPAIHPPQR